MKKLTSLLLALCLAATLALPASAKGLENFTRSRTYDGRFTDVPADSAVAPNIAAAFELGLMGGMSDTAFAPAGQLTVAQTVVVACRMHLAYYGLEKDLKAAPGQPWYGPSVDYAWENGILFDRELDWQTPVKRSVFAEILGAALPNEALEPISLVEWDSIPDVKLESPHSDAIYRLYRAGVLTGSDRQGTFGPDSPITRGAAAAIVTRMADPQLRKVISLVKPSAALVAFEDIPNRKALQRKATDEQMREAYDIAFYLMEPLAGASRQEQLENIALALRMIFEQGGGQYSTDDPNYNDPYGYLVKGTASCAGCARTTGLCLSILGIPFEHVNENQWTHQWCRVPVGDEYWICDAFGLYCGPEPAPYTHPYL